MPVSCKLTKEEMVDNYEDKLGTYMLKLNSHELNEADSKELSLLLHIIGDFERISDHAVKEEIIKKAVVIVNKKGWDSINARDLAKALKISTKPLYRIYQNMDEIKEDMYKEIYRQYDEFITSRVDNKKALVTLCVAYVEFAKIYKNLFVSLFLSNNLKWQSIDDVLNEKWNQGAIINLVNKQGYTFEEAKDLFMHVWLYANGLATLIATNQLDIDDKEIIVRIVKIFKTLEK